MAETPISTKARLSAEDAKRDSIGVRISGPGELSRGRACPISGVFRLSPRETAGLDDRLHRALVLTVRRPPIYHASTPFRRAVLFDDDETREGDLRCGSFTIDLGIVCPPPVPGSYAVTVSIGEQLSNLLQIRVD